jgi:hypothetical protein
MRSVTAARMPGPGIPGLTMRVRFCTGGRHGEDAMNSAGRPTIYHIPVCPFGQRLEILLALKQRRAAADCQLRIRDALVAAALAAARQIQRQRVGRRVGVDRLSREGP